MKTLTNGHLPINNKRRLIYLIFTLFIAFFSSSITAAGLELVKDINTEGSNSIYNLKAGSELLFFSAQTENNSNTRQIWTSDGTASGTLKMTDLDHSVYGFQLTNGSYQVVNNIYYFSIRRWSDNVYELWRSNGSAEGTFKLIDLPDYLDNRFQAIGADGLYYFVPWSDPDYGRELWVSDGSVAGTRMVKDINPGSGSSSPHSLMAVNDRLYFLVGDNIWTSNGTPGGTQVVTSFEESFNGGIRFMTPVNDIIYLGYLVPERKVSFLKKHHTQSTIIFSDLA